MDSLLTPDQRHHIVDALRVMFEYYTDQASDADLFRLQEIIASHCGTMTMKRETLTHGLDMSQLTQHSVNRTLQSEIAQAQLKQHVEQRGY